MIIIMSFIVITFIIFTIITNIAINMIIEIVRYYRDTYAEHPEDRKNIEYSVSFKIDNLIERWKL